MRKPQPQQQPFRQESGREGLDPGTGSGETQLRGGLPVEQPGSGDDSQQPPLQGTAGLGQGIVLKPPKPRGDDHESLVLKLGSGALHGQMAQQPPPLPALPPTLLPPQPPWPPTLQSEVQGAEAAAAAASFPEEPLDAPHGKHNPLLI